MDDLSPRQRLHLRLLLRRQGLFLLYCYLITLYLYFVLRVLTDHQLWVVSWMSSFLPQLMLPAFLLFPLALWRGHRLPAVLLVGLMVIFVALFGELLLPKRPDAPPGSTEITAMTFNIASWTSDPATIAAEIRRVDADIVALQEVDTPHADAIEQAVDYPYEIFYPVDSNITLGKALLSRYPVLDSEVFVMETQRPYIYARLLIAGQEVDVYNFHPAPPGYLRYKQIYGYNSATRREIQALMARLDPAIPTLLLCDCNLTDQYPSYQYFRQAGLRDSFRAAGWGFGMTFPASGAFGVRLPLLKFFRIDYIWVSDAFTPLHAALGRDVGSDHLALMAHLAFAPPAASE